MIHGLTMRRKLSPSGSLMRTEEPPSGCQDRVDWGQEGTGSMTVRIHSFLVSTFLLYTFVVVSLILPTSRRLVIRKIVFRVPDLTPLPSQLKVKTNKQS